MHESHALLHTQPLSQPSPHTMDNPLPLHSVPMPAAAWLLGMFFGGVARRVAGSLALARNFVLVVVVLAQRRIQHAASAVEGELVKGELVKEGWVKA